MTTNGLPVPGTACGEVDADGPEPATESEGSNTPAWQRHPGLLVGIVCVVAALLAITLSAGLRHQLALSFVPQHTDYSELYFPADGPIQVASDGAVSTIRVRFTIVNHENRANVYPYTVSVTDQQRNFVGSVQGSVAVPDGGTETSVEAVNVPASAAWEVVDVTLDGRAERIHLLRSELISVAQR